MSGTKDVVREVKKLQGLEDHKEENEKLMELFPKVKYLENGKAVPLCHWENTYKLFAHLGVVVRYNEMSKQVEIDIPKQWFHSDTELNAKLTFLEGKGVEYGLPIQKLDEHIQLLANQNVYHPVREWIESEDWDGKERLYDLVETVQSDNPLKDTLMVKWLISCVAALYLPKGIAAEGVLVFVGTQGIGKTSWLKSLVPVEGLDWVKDGVLLDPKDKDSVLQAVSYWLVELGEIGSTFRRSDIDQLKAFITQQNDVLRPAYARKADNYKRRTIFYGTVNDPTFLNDYENRRFWALELKSVNAKHGINIQQLWAEVKKYFEDGVGFYLTREELEVLQQEQEQFKSGDTVEDTLDQWVEIHGDVGDHIEYMNCTTLLKGCGIDRPNNGNLRTAANWLKRHNAPFQKHGKKYGVVMRSSPGVPVLRVVEKTKDVGNIGDLVTLDTRVTSR